MLGPVREEFSALACAYTELERSLLDRFDQLEQFCRSITLPQVILDGHGLDTELSTMTARCAEVETELETIRDRAAELAETVERLQREMETQQQADAQEIERLKQELDRQSAELQSTAHAPAAGRTGEDAVVGSVIEQFQKLRRQRHHGKRT